MMHKQKESFRMISVIIITCILGCSPALNWRKTTVGSLDVLLPCKPDQAKRTLMLNGLPVELNMMGCEADGLLFAVSHINAENLSQAKNIQSNWAEATLKNIKALDYKNPSLKGPNIKAYKSSTNHMYIQTNGTTEKGDEIQAQLQWFMLNNAVYHKAVYGKKMTQEQMEPFFDSP